MDADKTFSNEQKLLLRNKLQYPAKGAKSNITRYLKPNIIPNNHPLVPRIKIMATQGLNNCVIEFDTVINQMMIYMHLWKIPEDNAFYKKLRTVAQEAYNYRASART